MPWDDDKSTAADPDNPSANEQLSADEWDAHVADQKSHSTRHESGGSDEIGLGNLSLPTGAQIDEDGGDFVVRDSAGNVALRYDEASGAWQLDALEAGNTKTDLLTLTTVVYDNTFTYSGGETKAVVLSQGVSGDNIDVVVTPSNNPGNDHGYQVDRVYYDSGNDRVQADITETENAGGGSVRVLAYKIGTQ